VPSDQWELVVERPVAKPGVKVGVAHAGVDDSYAAGEKEEGGRRREGESQRASRKSSGPVEREQGPNRTSPGWRSSGWVTGQSVLNISGPFCSSKTIAFWVFGIS
jgi:hypothetical protein